LERVEFGEVAKEVLEVDESPEGLGRLSTDKEEL
jgi:hypothetical protein